MSNPYWGLLPGPKAPGQPPPSRRLSDEYSPVADRRASLDAAGPQQQQARANRASVQTTNTDAYTDSTLSPFASPTASSFQGQGLTPRPPSFPYGANQYPPELLERRKRRRSRNQDDDELQDVDAAAAAPPPAAPDVPKAPPVSYRHPYGNGGLPFTYAPPAPATRGATRPDPANAGRAQVDPQDYYKMSAADAGPGKENYPRPRPVPQDLRPGRGLKAPLERRCGRRRADTQRRSEGSGGWPAEGQQVQYRRSGAPPPQGFAREPVRSPRVGHRPISAAEA